MRPGGNQQSDPVRRNVASFLRNAAKIRYPAPVPSPQSPVPSPQSPVPSPQSMRIITFNANGIRSAANKGFFDWLRVQDADVVCLQETKAQEDQLSDPMFRPDGHHCFYRDATTKKGYSGVAIYAKREPDEIRNTLGWDAFDNEGRYLEARFGNLSVVSLYLPSGSSGEERQRFKFKVMEWIKPVRSEEHTSELQSPVHLVCRLLLEKKKLSLKYCLLSYSYSTASSVTRS